MSNRPSAKESRIGLAAVAASSRRSPLFYWMVDQHDELVRLSASGGFSWRTVCSVAAGLGLSDKKGQAPSVETARKTWLRARAYVRRRQQVPPSPVQPEQVEIMPPMSSSVPMGSGSALVPIRPPGSPAPSWMPAEHVVAQSSSIVAGDRPRTALNRMGETSEEAALRSAKNLANVRRSMAEAAGHIPPRKV